MEPEIKREIHPWLYYGSHNSKVLLVGTFPPDECRWSYPFFYPNKANYFWKIIAALQDKKLRYFTGDEAVVERKALLDQLQAAVTDMGAVILRKGSSSLDEDIFPDRFMDIASILEQLPSVRRLIFTSSSGKNSALSWFKQMLNQQGIKFRYRKDDLSKNVLTNFVSREIEIRIVRSPSPRSACGIGFEQLLEQYRSAIMDL